MTHCNEHSILTKSVAREQCFFGIDKWDLSSAGRASALQAEGHRFEPCRSHLKLIKLIKRRQSADYKSVALNNKNCADVAQLAEQLICNQQVIGSSPIIGFTLGIRIEFL